MAMTPAELKEREDRLRHDQINWEADKKARERVIAKLDHVREELEPKLSALDELRAEKTKEIDGLLDRSRELTAEIAKAGEQSTDLEAEIVRRQTTITELDAVIERKKAQIADNLNQWLTTRRAELAASMVDTQQALTVAQGDLESILGQISAKVTELDDLRQESATLQQEQQRIIREHETAIAKLQQRRVPLEGEIKALDEELLLKTRKLEIVSADMRKAKALHENFVDYERQARKVLDTKDRELQDKAQELAQESRHISAKRSYLSEL